MTDIRDRPADASPTAPQTAAAAPLWRPFAEGPVLTPAMALGWDATAPQDRERLVRYLSALVAARRAPVHVNVAFNAVYFGYDLTAGGYVGGPLDLFAFPQVRFGETTEALPVGAMVNIAAGEQPLLPDEPPVGPDGRAADTGPTSAAEPQSVPMPETPQPESDGDGGLGELTVTDSQVSWTQALRLTHLLEGRLPLPDVIYTQMRTAGLDGVRLRLMLTHDGYDLDPAEATQTVDADLFGRSQITGVEWPLEFFASIVLTCTWGRGTGVVRATTTLLGCPVIVAGMEIEHRYDPRILTRDAAPGQPRRGGRPGQRLGAGPLSSPERVLRAVRRLGLLHPDGRAVLARAHLPAVVYGTADATAVTVLDVVVDELLAAGELRSDIGSVDASWKLRFPPEPGAPTVPLIVYEPCPVEGPPRAIASRRSVGILEARFVRMHAVAGHLRWIGDVGRTASEEARHAYREDRARFRLLGPTGLPKGYTYVRPHSRGSS